MKTFGKRTDILGGLRKVARESISLAAATNVCAHEKIVMISDLGCKGAKLAGNGLPPQEARISLTVGELELTCRVAWSTGSNCGVEFSAELNVDELEELKLQGRTGRIYSVV